ncbi:hypothetical protein O4H45_22490, partial [Vibrio atlanticus]|nr:hypothetical protein [Vibrio atlanticus]
SLISTHSYLGTSNTDKSPRGFMGRIQFKSDVLLVFMPKAKMEHIEVLRGKIEALCSLIEDDDFTLNVFAWGIPDPTMKEDVGYWLESKVSEIYAVS